MVPTLSSICINLSERLKISSALDCSASVSESKGRDGRLTFYKVEEDRIGPLLAEVLNPQLGRRVVVRLCVRCEAPQLVVRDQGGRSRSVVPIHDRRVSEACRGEEMTQVTSITLSKDLDAVLSGHRSPLWEDLLDGETSHPPLRRHGWHVWSVSTALAHAGEAVIEWVRDLHPLVVRFDRGEDDGLCLCTCGSSAVGCGGGLTIVGHDKTDLHGRELGSQRTTDGSAGEGGDRSGYAQGRRWLCISHLIMSDGDASETIYSHVPAA